MTLYPIAARVGAAAQHAVPRSGRFASSPTGRPRSSGICFTCVPSCFKNLLRQDSLASIPIARLAHQCGFADAAHATRTFKNRFGVTPRDFREGAPR
jgi:AraC-like DNA-binding protein